MSLLEGNDTLKLTKIKMVNMLRYTPDILVKKLRLTVFDDNFSGRWNHWVNIIMILKYKPQLQLIMANTQVIKNYDILDVENMYNFIGGSTADLIIKCDLGTVAIDLTVDQSLIDNKLAKLEGLGFLAAVVVISTKVIVNIDDDIIRTDSLTLDNLRLSLLSMTNDEKEKVSEIMDPIIKDALPKWETYLLEQNVEQPDLDYDKFFTSNDITNLKSFVMKNEVNFLNSIDNIQFRDEIATNSQYLFGDMLNIPIDINFLKTSDDILVYVVFLLLSKQLEMPLELTTYIIDEYKNLIVLVDFKKDISKYKHAKIQKWLSLNKPNALGLFQLDPQHPHCISMVVNKDTPHDLLNPYEKNRKINVTKPQQNQITKLLDTWDKDISILTKQHSDQTYTEVSKKLKDIEDYLVKGESKRALSTVGMDLNILTTNMFQMISHTHLIALSLIAKLNNHGSHNRVQFGFNGFDSSLIITKTNKNLTNFTDLKYKVIHVSNPETILRPLKHVRLNIASHYETKWLSVSKNMLEWWVKLPGIAYLRQQYYNEQNIRLSKNLEPKFNLLELATDVDLAVVNRQQFSVLSEQTRYIAGAVNSVSSDYLGPIKKMEGLTLKYPSEVKYYISLIKLHISAFKIKNMHSHRYLLQLNKMNKSRNVAMIMPNWVTARSDLMVIVDSFFTKTMINKEKTHSELSEAQCMNDLLDEEMLYRDFIKDKSADQINGFTELDSNMITGDPADTIKYLQSKEFKDQLTEQIISIMMTDDSKRFTWNPWLSIMSCLTSGLNFENVKANSGNNILTDVFNMPVDKLFSNAGSMQLECITSKNQSLRKTSATTHFIGCFYSDSNIPIKAAVQTINSHIDFYGATYISVGLLTWWSMSQKHDILIRLFDKDQTGGHREISALNAPGFTYCYFSENCYRWLSLHSEEDCISRPDKDKIIFEINDEWHKFINKEDDEIEDLNKLSFSKDCKRYGPNQMMPRMLLQNSCLTSNVILLNLLDNTNSKLIKKQFKMPEKLFDIISAYKDVNSLINHHPDGTITSVAIKSNKINPLFMIAPKFNFEWGMPQGLNGCQASVFTSFSNRYLRMIELYVSSGEILWNAVRVTSDDSTSWYTLADESDSINVGKRIFVFESRFLKLTGHILNRSKSTISKTISELNSKWFSNGQFINVTGKMVLSNINIGTGSDPGLDVIGPNISGVNLLRDGSSIFLATSLALYNTYLYMTQYNRWFIFNKIHKSFYYDMLGVCPITIDGCLLNPLIPKILSYLDRMTVRDQTSGVLLTNVIDYIVSKHVNFVASVTHPLLEFMGKMPLAVTDGAVEFKFYKGKVVKHVLSELNINSFNLNSYGLLIENTTNIANTMTNMWFTMAIKEQETRGSESFLNRFGNPRRSFNQANILVGTNSLIYKMTDKTELSYKEIEDICLSTDNVQNYITNFKQSDPNITLLSSTLFSLYSNDIKRILIKNYAPLSIDSLIISKEKIRLTTVVDEMSTLKNTLTILEFLTPHTAECSMYKSTLRGNIGSYYGHDVGGSSPSDNANKLLLSKRINEMVLYKLYRGSSGFFIGSGPVFTQPNLFLKTLKMNNLVCGLGVGSLMVDHYIKYDIPKLKIGKPPFRRELVGVRETLIVDENTPYVLDVDKPIKNILDFMEQGDGAYFRSQGMARSYNNFLMNFKPNTSFGDPFVIVTTHSLKLTTNIGYIRSNMITLERNGYYSHTIFPSKLFKTILNLKYVSSTNFFITKNFQDIPLEDFKKIETWMRTGNRVTIRLRGELLIFLDNRVLSGDSVMISRSILIKIEGSDLYIPIINLSLDRVGDLQNYGFGTDTKIPKFNKKWPYFPQFEELIAHNEFEDLKFFVLKSYCWLFSRGMNSAISGLITDSHTHLVFQLVSRYNTYSFFKKLITMNIKTEPPYDLDRYKWYYCQEIFIYFSANPLNLGIFTTVTYVDVSFYDTGIAQMLMYNTDLLDMGDLDELDMEDEDEGNKDLMLDTM
jgi:hypothetical protein